MISGRLSINVLIDLYNQGKETRAVFDFVNQTISPSEAIRKESLQLMEDYTSWLPDHFQRHNCDLSELEMLEISFWTDFENAQSPPGMNDTIEFTLYC